MLKELGRLEEAEASYNQAIALEPNLAEAHNNLGTTLHELGRLEEAKERVAIRTRQYAKRQLTWQRGQMKDWKGFNDTNYLDLRKKILSYLSKT